LLHPYIVLQDAQLLQKKRASADVMPFRVIQGHCC